jgi:hypothetical protein
MVNWLLIGALVAIAAAVARDSSSKVSHPVDDHGLLRSEEGDEVYFVLNFAEPHGLPAAAFQKGLEELGFDPYQLKWNGGRTALVIGAVTDPMQIKVNTWFDFPGTNAAARFTRWSALDDNAQREFDAN